MGFVYLIGESSTPNVFKIGSTRKKDINDRMKQLQTGNPDELYLARYFETESPFKVEHFLHFNLSDHNSHGEWFEVGSGFEDRFMEMCRKAQDIVDSLDGNPFYNKK